MIFHPPPGRPKLIESPLGTAFFISFSMQGMIRILTLIETLESFCVRKLKEQSYTRSVIILISPSEIWLLVAAHKKSLTFSWRACRFIVYRALQN